MSFDISNLKYIQLLGFSEIPLIRIYHLEGYIQQLTEKKIKSIFRYKIIGPYSNAEDIKWNRFIFIESGVGYSFQTSGYSTLTDMLEGIKLGFKDCSQKYLVKDDKIEKKGYHHYSEDGEVYYIIRKLGYDNFNEFDDAFSNGWGDIDIKIYRQAKKDGFKSYNDYSEYKEAGFEDTQSYYEAKGLEIKNNAVYNEYLRIKKVKEDYKFNTFDEAHVFMILNRKSLGKRKKLDLIMNILNEEKPSNGFNGGQSKWYTESINNDSSALADFLFNNPHASNIGMYYQKSEEFENYSGTKIFVDGSNVARNNGDSASGDKPKAKNIQLVIEKIREFGFKDIVVLCDANLEHEIDDKEVFDDLKELKLIKNVPFKTDADEFIINYAKKFETRIITNDRFKDWALKDKWVNDHADDVSIRFMIIDDEVEFSTRSGKIKAESFKANDFDFKGFKQFNNKSR